MKEFVLIDGNYWLFSSYYATASMGNLMVNKDGIPTNAVFGFNSLSDVIASNNLNENEYIRTFGKNTYNDGYNALYKIRTLTSADVVDNENIIALNNYPTLIAEKIKNFKKWEAPAE